MNSNQPRLHLQDLPFKIPPSLSSFVEQFESDPDKSIERLEVHLKKLGMDAVGYFILAYMYHKKGNRVLAHANAQKAQCFAPGSSLFANLNYFLLHPLGFEAGLPDQSLQKESHKAKKNIDFDLNLESLISKLSDADSIGERKTHQYTDDDTDLSLPAQMVGDIASETLAMIHEKQGKLQEAIEAYKTLQKVRPKLSDKYQKHIDRLEDLIEAEKSKEEK